MCNPKKLIDKTLTISFYFEKYSLKKVENFSKCLQANIFQNRKKNLEKLIYHQMRYQNEDCFALELFQPRKKSRDIGGLF